MLEFQEGFFDQEIREDFYIDATMKTVWAASLEVLQRVAEVCSRHGIDWYAAYGTLLGAIRHEGFIPWDDDLDIWVKRKDYNKLLQLLPRELPAGYLVKSPLTAKGFGQFHTLVQNTEYLCLDREWLEQYHGCPFTVGVDIYPLDYLPRQKQDRTVQEKLAAIAARGAQVANYIIDEEYKRAEDPVEEKNAYVQEIWEGVLYLEENCGARIDHRLIEEEKWDRLASELGKWANYIAMMYEEEESDCLVNFINYVRWPQQCFPKEWFAEVYSASFENFMLPIPCKYDEILRQIYGDYHVCRRGGTSHDYPNYEKQLEKLRELVRQREQTAGGSAYEEIFPAGWEKLLVLADGAGKKIVLYTNDISDFITYRAEALDKLESVLKTFYEAGEKVLLWWRPTSEMMSALGLVDQKLAERYSAILGQYKAAGWGICDESSDKQRAVEMCDAYYGAGNNLIGKLQNRGKPIMVAAGR